MEILSGAGTSFDGDKNTLGGVGDTSLSSGSEDASVFIGGGGAV